MIIVENVYKRYITEHGPGDWILNGLSFTIPPKVNVGLVGRNGAGKSTLLRLIGGIDVPTKGHIERRCRVSWPMGFGGGLQGSLTGRQNAKFVCRIHGHEADLEERIKQIDDFAEIGKYFDEPVKTYSSGMRSRLNFALSMAFDFDVYISDEITATGDAAFKAKAKSAFKKLSDHASIIMVSHGEGTLREFCTAGIWLHEGRAHWFDDVEDALSAYKESLPEYAAMERVKPAKARPNVTLAKLINFRRTINWVEAGLEGRHTTLKVQECASAVRQAKRMGVELLTPDQIEERGAVLKHDVQPILQTLDNRTGLPCNYFDVATQCEILDKP